MYSEVEHMAERTARNIEALAFDMRNDRWLLTHQGIAFNRDGFLPPPRPRRHKKAASLSLNKVRTLPHDSPQ
jgi:hypothetical protein